jgi:hypothetical protein
LHFSSRNPTKTEFLVLSGKDPGLFLDFIFHSGQFEKNEALSAARQRSEAHTNQKSAKVNFDLIFTV